MTTYENTTGMTRREALKTITAFAAGVSAVPFLSGAACSEPSGRKQPNIIVMVADDLGYGDVGCFGCTDISTPNLDRLASEGVRFTQFYVSSPLCAPTRVSLMTGRHPNRTSLSWNPSFKDDNSGLSPDETTLAEVLKDAGYTTGLVGKWHLGYAPRFRPRNQGFDEFYGFLSGWADYYSHHYHGQCWMFRNDEPFNETGYMTDLLTREAKAFIDRHKGDDKPFFLYLPYNAPHWPDQAPQEWMEKSRRGVFGAMVECLDDSIGQVMKHVADSGLENDTFVIFFSDNGADGRGRNAPFSGGKGNLREGGIRTPMIARWPGRIPAGTVVNEPIISMDLFTTAALAGGGKLPTNVKIDGRNALDTMAGTAPSPHDYLFWWHGDQEAVRYKQWKLLKSGGKLTGLFNLAEDPEEKTDVSKDNPELVKQLTQRLEEWKSEVEAG